jgi:amicyanin
MKRGKIALIISVAVIVLIGGYFLLTQKNVNTSQVSEVASSGRNIDISNFQFQPNELTISVGETVTWTNKDSATHTITSDSGNEVGSQGFSKGEVYSHTFTEKGTYEYHCSFHSSMKGKIIVE